MKLVVFFIGLTLICSFCFSVSAQTSPTEITSPTESKTEKEKTQKELEKRVLEILDQAVGDAATLKLPQNRAIVYVIAGDLYWKFDEKRARELFRSCESEILAANAEDEKAKKENDDPFYMYYEGGGGLRGNVLPLIARHDGELALQILISTRSPKLVEALAKLAQPNAKQEGGYFSFNPEQFRAREEIGLEQLIALAAAEQNLDKAIKLFKDSLARGISWFSIPMLQKISKKDEKKASSLADDLITRITDTDLTKRGDDLDAAVQLFQYAVNPEQLRDSKEKPFKFNDGQIKDIANKLAATFMQPSNAINTSMLMTRAMPNLEKIVPEKAALIKQAQAETMKNLPPEVKRMQQQQKLWSPSATPEEILADLPKINDYDKDIAYRALTDKISRIDDETRAKKLIEQIPDEQIRSRAAEQYESAQIGRAANDGKLDEAKKRIKNLSEKKTQIQQLVELAVQFKKKNTEKDNETALNLMKDAKALVNESPEDENELNNLMDVIRGYATIDASEAFRLFEPIVDQLNDFVQASAILSKYNKRSQTFKKGELLMKVNGYSWEGLLLFRYIDQIQLLGKADLNKMNTFSDKFQRNDARTIVKLFIAQGFLKEEKKDENIGN